MNIRMIPEAPHIQDTDGFSKCDIFEARETGERLANMVGNLEGHSVIVFDGPWGTGKSVFVQQWAGLLRQRGHPVVYFDAFAHDHLDDAFFPLFGALLHAKGTGDPPLASARRRLIEKATPLVRALPSLLTDIGIRAATAGNLKTKDIREAVEASEAQSIDPAQAMIDEHLTQMGDHVACVQRFRQELESAVSALGNNKEKPPLVFIVDELDRCRPAYALRVLERMKHVFSANGVCFVLVTHLTELTAMVKRTYGLVDPAAYLEQFYHRRFDFRKLLLRGSEKLRLRYIDYLADGFSIKRDPDSFATITIDNLTRLQDVSLRGQERIMLNLALCHSALSGTQRRVSNEVGFQLNIAPGLAAMRHLDQELFGYASSQELGFADAIAFLKIEEWVDISPDGKDRVEYWWRLATLDGFEDMPDGGGANRPDTWGHQSCRRLVANTCAIIDLMAS
jgi:hypothetical protein